MANHALPTTASLYTALVSEFDSRIADIAKWLASDTTTPTNLPSGAVRWNATSLYFEKWNGTAWATLSTSYNFNINGTVGATTPAAGTFTVLTANTSATLPSNTTIGGVAAVTLTATQTLTNKTLTTPVISTISNTGTITLPTSTDTLVGRATTDTLTNKTLTAPKFASGGFIADTNGNELLEFTAVASAANGINITNAATATAPAVKAIGTDTNINLNLVSKGTGVVTANGIEIVTVSGSQTLTNKTLTSPTISTITNTGTITLPTSTDTLVGRTTTDTLTNKTLTAPKFADLGFIADQAGLAILTFDSNTTAVNSVVVTNQATGIAPTVGVTGTDTNINLNLVSKGTGIVTANGVGVVTLTGTQTLTNKTLTAPVIASISNTGTLTLPTTTDTLVGRDTTDTLTNKTLTAPKFASGGFIADTSGNELLEFTSVASAANGINITNAVTATAPAVKAIGTDTNINLNLVSKGTGLVTANGVEVATISGTQTLTNKTLTSPVIGSIVNTGTLTLPTTTDTLVGRATTDTLTNKTLTSPTIGGTVAGTFTFGGTVTFTNTIQGSISGSATSSSNASITDDVASASTHYIYMGTATSGTTPIKSSSTKLSFNPSTGSLTAAGNITAYSDDRLKKDWLELPDDFIYKLVGIKYGTYTRTDTGARQAGVSAQDMKAILNEVVVSNTDKQNTLSIAYGNAALVSVIKLAAKVINLEKQLQVLEARI